MPLATIYSDATQGVAGADNKEAIKAGDNAFKLMMQNAKDDEAAKKKQEQGLDKAYGKYATAIDKLGTTAEIAQDAKDRIYKNLNDKKLSEKEKLDMNSRVLMDTEDLANFWKTHAANVELVKSGGGGYSKMNEIDGTMSMNDLISSGRVKPVRTEKGIRIIGKDEEGNEIDLALDEYINNPSTQMLMKVDLTPAAESVKEKNKKVNFLTSVDPQADANTIYSDIMDSISGQFDDINNFRSMAADYSNLSDSDLLKLTTALDRKGRGLPYDERFVQQMEDQVMKDAAMKLGVELYGNRFKEALSGQFRSRRRTGSGSGSGSGDDGIYHGDKNYDPSGLGTGFTEVYSNQEFVDGENQNRYYDIATASIGTNADNRDQSFFTDNDANPPEYDVNDDGVGKVKIFNEKGKPQLIEVNGWEDLKKVVGEYAAQIDGGGVATNVANFVSGSANEKQIDAALSGDNIGIIVDRLDFLFENENVDFYTKNNNLTVNIGDKNITIDMNKVGSDPKTRYSYIMAVIDRLK